MYNIQNSTQYITNIITTYQANHNNLFEPSQKIINKHQSESQYLLNFI